MGKQTDEALRELDDYGKIQTRLRKDLQNDPLLYVLSRVAEMQDWDQIRALKTAVVVLAAQRRDLFDALCAQPPPPIIIATPHIS